jgi:hypothetical protein
LAGAPAIFGFNPVPGVMRICDVMDALKRGGAFPGSVGDDSPVFAAAAGVYRLTVQTFTLRMPVPAFLEFKTRLDNEVVKTNYKYGFPDGDGDCNCITWLERLGLPLLTGRMDEFATLPGFALYPARRFGQCS